VQRCVKARIPIVSLPMHSGLGNAAVHTQEVVYAHNPRVYNSNTRDWLVLSRETSTGQLAWVSTSSGLVNRPPPDHIVSVGNEVPPTFNLPPGVGGIMIPQANWGSCVNNAIAAKQRRIQQQNQFKRTYSNHIRNQVSSRLPNMMNGFNSAPVQLTDIRQKNIRSIFQPASLEKFHLIPAVPSGFKQKRCFSFDHSVIQSMTNYMQRKDSYRKPRLRKPKHPKTGYNYFQLRVREQLCKDIPENSDRVLHNEKVARIIGQRWKALSKDERKVFQDLARKDKIRYEIEMSNYMKKIQTDSTTNYSKPLRSSKALNSARSLDNIHLLRHLQAQTPPLPPRTNKRLRPAITADNVLLAAHQNSLRQVPMATDLQNPPPPNPERLIQRTRSADIVFGGATAPYVRDMKPIYDRKSLNHMDSKKNAALATARTFGAYVDESRTPQSSNNARSLNGAFSIPFNPTPLEGSKTDEAWSYSPGVRFVTSASSFESKKPVEHSTAIAMPSTPSLKKRRVFKKKVTDFKGLQQKNNSYKNMNTSGTSSLKKKRLRAAKSFDVSLSSFKKMRDKGVDKDLFTAGGKGASKDFNIKEWIDEVFDDKIDDDWTKSVVAEHSRRENVEKAREKKDLSSKKDSYALKRTFSAPIHHKDLFGNDDFFGGDATLRESKLYDDGSFLELKIPEFKEKSTPFDTELENTKPSLSLSQDKPFLKSLPVIDSSNFWKDDY